MRISIIFCFVAVLCASCHPAVSEKQVREIMGEWYKKQIKFPEGLQLLNPANTDPRFWNSVDTSDAPYHIIHFFTADCDKCINELKHAQEWIRMHPSQKNLKYIFIASGPTQVYARDAVEKSGFQLPVYFEKEYFSFKRINGLPLSDQLYDTMLINNKGEVLLFGAVFDNDKAEDLFFNIVKSGI